jgi:two-component system response regulator PilR (NtrC family)
VKKKPLKKKSSPKKPAKVAPARLLVVDDEADFAKLIQTILTQAGYRVDLATSATAAIALQRKNAYDLAIVDILMTAYGSFSVGIEALRQGACDYVSKPFKNKALKEKVAEALKRRQQYIREQHHNSSVDEL